MSRSTMDGGGAIQMRGGSLEMSGTVGQPDAGLMAGGTFQLSGGFWLALAPGDCNEDGNVGLFDYAALEQCLIGPAMPFHSGCNCFDTNATGTVDLADFAKIQTAFFGT